KDAREREVRRFGDAVGAEHLAAANAADRGNNHDRAATARRHARAHEVGEPDGRLHVRAHDLVEGFVGELGERAEHRVDGGVAHQNVDAAPLFDRPVDQRLDLIAPRHVARDDDRSPPFSLMLAATASSRCSSGYGGKTSAKRSPQQSETARLWLMVGPPAYHPFVRQLVTAKQMSVGDSARLMALAAVGLNEATFTADPEAVIKDWQDIMAVNL